MPRRATCSYGTLLTLADRLGEPETHAARDPQTSGGLLVACAPDTVTEVLSIFLQRVSSVPR